MRRQQPRPAARSRSPLGRGSSERHSRDPSMTPLAEEVHPDIMMSMCRECCCSHMPCASASNLSADTPNYLAKLSGHDVDNAGRQHDVRAACCTSPSPDGGAARHWGVGQRAPACVSRGRFSEGRRPADAARRIKAICPHSGLQQGLALVIPSRLLRAGACDAPP